ncbi:MAG TPA: hypothetical protein VHS29_06370 [Candidatus Acidoferrales bacterium]|nr:hypothetical protein [Candidatus Acidoferrales bacterium]
MKAVIFGATGMVGQGVLRECLIDPEVERIITVGRTEPDISNPKLQNIILADMFNYTSIEPQLTGLDACFFCLGVSAAGLSEEQYEKLTFTLTLAAAETLSRLNPSLTFIYVSGAGTDSSEKGRMMWARVKGKTENTLLGMRFKSAYMFRPGIIQPAHGEQSKTRAYRIGYALFRPVFPLLRLFLRRQILTTEEIGRAMINVARRGASKKILEVSDISACAKSESIAS